MPAESEPDASVAARGDLVTVFTREALAVGAVVHGPMLPGEATVCVAAILQGVGAKTLLAWDSAELSVPGIREELAMGGFGILDARLPSDRKARAERLLRLGEAEAGLTGADAGLAETGTLVMGSGPGRPRLACLLPPVHVALLPVPRIVPDLSHFLAAGDNTRDPASVVLVSGPSRTGDIELTLIRGMHGPREVHVVLVG